MDFRLAIFFSTVHALTFFLYSANYARLRKNDVYAKDKKTFERLPLARKITKVAFTVGTILVLASFWMPTGTPGFFEAPLGVREAGLALTFMAFLALKKALDQLGANYSPVFDTHKPKFIVREGLYRRIRHPVYLCNILIIAGYVLASCSVWVLLTSLWGWGYMLRSIQREERDLAAEFPEYRDYQKSTWRILPYIY